ANLTLAGAVAGGAVAGAASSAASQAVGIATGVQDSFSWKGVAIGAIGGAISGGLGFSGPLKGTDAVRSGIRAATSSAVTQAVGVATGLQDRFDWTGVAVAGVAGGAGAWAGNHINFISGPLEFSPGTRAGAALSGAAGGIAAAAAESLVAGKNFGDTIVSRLPEIIGASIGNSVAANIQSRQQRNLSESELASVGGMGAGYLHGGSAQDTLSTGTSAERPGLFARAGRAFLNFVAAPVRALQRAFDLSPTDYTLRSPAMDLSIDDIPSVSELLVTARRAWSNNMEALSGGLAAFRASADARAMAAVRGLERRSPLLGHAAGALVGVVEAAPGVSRELYHRAESFSRFAQSFGPAGLANDLTGLSNLAPGLPSAARAGSQLASAAKGAWRTLEAGSAMYEAAKLDPLGAVRATAGYVGRGARAVEQIYADAGGGALGTEAVTQRFVEAFGADAVLIAVGAGLAGRASSAGELLGAVDGLAVRSTMVVSDARRVVAAKAAESASPLARTYSGGAYGRLSSEAGVIERHHAPPNSLGFTTEYSGPAIQIDYADHLLTSSHTRMGLEGKIYRREIQDLLNKGDVRGAMAREVLDIRRAAVQGGGSANKYNGAVREMLDYSYGKGWLDK
ncbi:MAG TPA: hypothetical protein VIO94_15345, partial [Phenylobacterium sp.]